MDDLDIQLETAQKDISNLKTELSNITKQLTDVRQLLQKHQHTGVDNSSRLRESTELNTSANAGYNTISYCSGTPTGVAQNGAIMFDKTNDKLYVYDTNAWVQVGISASVYGGAVNSDGTAGTPFPSGWSSTKPSTGNYTITHNFGNTNYTIAALSTDQIFLPVVFQRNNNDVKLTLHNIVTLSASDTAFNFIIFKS